MVKEENECCDCATPLYPCIGDLCSRRHVKRYYCDRCEVEDILYEYEGEQLCRDCLIENFDIVEGSD